jgi:copper resistance protein D
VESQAHRHDQGCWPALVALLFVLFLFVFQPVARPQRQNPAGMQDMPGMEMHEDSTTPAADDSPERIAKLLVDKRESEFNHHLAGFLVLLAGLFILAQDRLAARWPGVRFVWPSCFLLAGLFLLLFSDTEMWPVGRQTPWFALTDSVEVVQHKIFSIVLLVLGYIELQRARGKFKSPWLAWIFPVLAGLGAMLLLFHKHRAGMHGANHMAVMEHIQRQHRAYAATGVGIAVSKGLSDMNWPSRQFFSRLCGLLMILLGILLMFYSE